MIGNSTILITGGTGAIGSVLVNRLVSSGHRIRLLTLVGDPAAAQYENHQFVELRYGDIADRTALEKICDGVSTVIHLAAIIITENEADYERINIRGTKNILDEAKQSGVTHFIHISSASVLYPKTTAYSLSKRVGERLVRESGVYYTIVRPTLVYGKRGGQEFDTFLTYLKRFPIIPFIGEGEAVKRPVFVEDIIDGLVTLSGIQYGTGNVYNFSGGNAITMIDFARYCLMLSRSGEKIFFHIPVWICGILSWVLKKTMKHPPLRWDIIAGITQDADLDPADTVRDLNFKASKLTDTLPGCFPRGV